ncbi:MAG: hypothetical protein HUU01_04515 [Saprospiraceae bacterium]|nr:hypothetical protein [Saprospiraceae bacterium]
MNQTIKTPAFSVEELETRHELSIIAPGDLATEAVKKDGEDRCDGDKEAPVTVNV